MATNEEHGLVAFGWTDRKPVYFLTTADGNAMGTVRRQVNAEKKVLTHQ